MLKQRIRYSARYQARLDAETYAKLEELARTFDRKRSVVLRCVMQWGLTQTQGWAIDRSIPTTIQPVAMLVEPELIRQVEQASAAHETRVAVWVRHALRQVTPDDFPASWHTEVRESGQSRSHDSRRYRTRFRLRLDETTAQKLQLVVDYFGKPRAEVMRQLVAQATPKSFPASWQLAVTEPLPPPRRA
jgi:predicted transcriptional regulator